MSTLSLATRIAIQLALPQRLVVSAMAEGKERKGVVGLQMHALGKCPCARNPGLKCRVDYHGEGGEVVHPGDFIAECPAKHYDPVLTRAVFDSLRIEDLGGLATYYGRSLELLPAALVDFFVAVTDARDRFLAYRDASQASLRK